MADSTSREGYTVFFVVKHTRKRSGGPFLSFWQKQSYILTFKQYLIKLGLDFFDDICENIFKYGNQLFTYMPVIFYILKGVST